MMKRFSRKRRGSGDGKASVIDARAWMTKISEQGIVEATSLEPWTDAGVPDGVAAIGRGERVDGSKVLVAFSPNSATEAMLGGLAAAQQASTESVFTGELLIVAPQWPAGARRVLGLLGQTPYSIEPIAAPGLTEGRVVVEAEPAPRILATSASQLASRMLSPESRSAFTRAAAALEGLAAKHGGCVRIGVDRLELVVLARRVAEIRADGENAVLEVQIGGRTTTPLSGADLAGALDGLEGQLRRRLNDRKVRDGEEGLRGRVIAQLATGSELRGLRAWPQPGTDQDSVDGVGINASGDPVVVAVREAFDWRSLGAVLESLAPIGALLPVLFGDTAPPLRLGMPRLLLTAERFADGLEKALSALTVPYELRAVSGQAGAGVALVSRAAGEGADSRPGRRPRRRGGRGRAGGAERDDEGSEENESGSDAVRGGNQAAAPSGRAPGERPLGPRSQTADGNAEDDEGGRGRGRRRRRPKRGGRPGEDAENEASSSGEGQREESGRGRFEELSMMDLDESRGGADATTASDDEADSGSKSRRGRRRGRRGGPDGNRGSAGPRSDNNSGNPSGDSASGASDDEDRPPRGGSRANPRDGGRAKLDADANGEDSAEGVGEEDDLVDADDLLEILARLADDAPDLESDDASEPSYDDDDDDDDEGDSKTKSAPRASQRRSRRGFDDDDEGRTPPRKRSAILVHGDPDSLLAAVLLARDIRQLEGMWVYPQEELMTFFRSIATDLREDTPIFLVGFQPSPAHDVVQAAALYKGRLTWFARDEWPPEDLAAMRDSIGADAILGGEGIDSTLPLVLETCSRRSRFSDKLVDLATGRFTQHDFERWGRLWRARAIEIAAKSGDIRADVAALLTGRPSDLAKEAALVAVPEPPPEVAWIAERDFRLVHFGGHVMVVLDVDPPIDVHLASRVARERYDASLSLARATGQEVFVFAGDETTGKRSLDYMAIAEHLVDKLEWVEARPDADHVSRFRVRDLERHPERLEEIISEIAMGRSLLER